jgi:hypothetical protein
MKSPQEELDGQRVSRPSPSAFLLHTSIVVRPVVQVLYSTFEFHPLYVLAVL